MLWETAYKGRLPVVEYWMECGTELDQPGCYYTPMLAEVAPKTAALLKAQFFVAQALEERGPRWILTVHVISEISAMCEAA